MNISPLTKAQTKCQIFITLNIDDMSYELFIMGIKDILIIYANFIFMGHFYTHYVITLCIKQENYKNITLIYEETKTQRLSELSKAIELS